MVVSVIGRVFAATIVVVVCIGWIPEELSYYAMKMGVFARATIVSEQITVAYIVLATVTTMNIGGRWNTLAKRLRHSCGHDYGRT